jgi:antibiotic biosynthesis monooxygenase (ABM) superfamily enzyme
MYLKGLGSWDSTDMKHVIKTDGIDNMIKIFNFDNDEILNDWLGTNSEPRKVYITENVFNIAKL